MKQFQDSPVHPMSIIIESKMQFIVPVSLDRQPSPCPSSSPIKPIHPHTPIIHAVHIPNKQHNLPPTNIVAHHTSHTQFLHTANTYAPPHPVLHPLNSHKTHIVLCRRPLSFRHPRHLARNVFVLRIIVTRFWLRIRTAKRERQPRRDCAEMAFGRDFLMTRGEISR